MKGTLGRDWAQEARDVIGYFEMCIAGDSAHFKELPQETEKGRSGEWNLGLFMAHQWSRFVLQSSPDKEEINLFCRALESQKTNYGCGWRDLTIRAEHWAQSLGALDSK